MKIKPYWRKNSTLERILTAIKTNSCGELRSIRFNWSRPPKFAASNEEFLYQIFASALDGAQFLADSKIKTLAVKKVPDFNNLFAMSQFENGIVAEFEFNETLSRTMFDVCTIKADFTHGHVSNRPLVGHLNEEGMLLSSDEDLTFPIAENDLLTPANGPIEAMLQRYNAANYSEIDGDELKNLIDGALKNE